MPSLEYETDRLVVRKYAIEDANAAFEMVSDPEVMKYIVNEEGLTFELIKGLIENNVLADYRKYGYGRMAVVEKESGQFVGFSGLKYLDNIDEVDVGFRFIKKSWGKGYATEANLPSIAFGFEELNLNRIIAMAVPDNQGSFRVMEKLGMSYDKNLFFEGHEMIQYVITKEDYFNRQGGHTS